MIRRSKEATEKRAALGFVLGGMLFVFGWRAVVMAHQYFQEPRMVRELCAISQYEQGLNPNRANTRLVFCQDTDEGVGIYFCDTADGKPRLLCEQKEKGRRGRRFTMLGWTPDDSRFACALPDNEKDQELILIFNGRTGERLSRVVADQSFQEFGWLSNESFAYSVGGSSVRIVTKQGNGDWVHKRFFEKVATNMDNFTAISASSVAWRDQDGIGGLNLDSGSTERIWEATTNQLMEFTYDRAANAYLLNCSDEAGQYLLGFRPHDQRSINLGRISSHQAYIRKATWKGNGSSYVFLTNDLAGSAFCIKAEGMKAPVTITWHGGVRNCTLNGNHLFFYGNPDDQVPGIWDYDLKSATYKRIVSSTGNTFTQSLDTPSTSLALTNSLGESRYYHLWPPPHILPNQKYPVLVAQEQNSWFPYFQIAAQSGCYVAVVDRPFFNTWDGEPQETWVEDVSTLYQLMAQKPNIDTNCIYLYACSRETFFLSRWMNERPTLAKGAILFSPVALPNASVLKNKRMLIVDGITDGDATKWIPEFQDRVAAKGNEITVFFQDAAGHIAASGTTERNRARQFVRFMSDQR